MILIFSRDQDAVREIARNQANASQAVFGPTRQAFASFSPTGGGRRRATVPQVVYGLGSQTVASLPPIGNTEDLFIVAQGAKRGVDWSPVVGDDRADSWTATQTMQVLDKLIPQNFAGNIYVAACEVADHESSVAFAKSLKAQLVNVRRNVGDVFGHVDAARGPIPPPADRRWIEADAA